MKVALVHDQLQEFGGAERVLVALMDIFPDAPIYTSFYNPQSLGKHAELFKNKDITTSWVQNIPFLNKLYSPFRFLIPLIWENFNFNNYDAVISSSGWFMCKGIITKPHTLHICYLHHPPRSFYYYETAVEWQKHLPFKIYGTLINHRLRLWDYISSQRPNFFIANSEETKKRITKFYRRDSTVIYPPVTIPKEPTPYTLHSTNYYLTVSRLARAKHIDILIEAANKQKFNLKIVGIGRDEEHLKKIAGPTVEFLGNVSDKELSDIYRRAKAFLFSSVDEEFGIAPIEAMGYGLPVLAYASGGLKETIKDGRNGYLFQKLSANSLGEKIIQFETLSNERYIEMRKYARKESEQYSFENFKKHILKFIDTHRTSAL